MPTIRLAGWWAGLAGRNGGSTIYQGRTGLIWRNMHRGKNPQTAEQRLVRQSFKSYSQAWRALDANKQIAWNKDASGLPKKNKVGTSYTGSGAAFFSAVNDTANFVNSVAVMTGITAPVTVPIEDPPPLTPPVVEGNIDNLVASNHLGTQTLTLDIPKVDTGDCLILYATSQMSAGRFFAKGKFRPIKYFAAGAAQTAANILAAYQSVFGDLIEGKKFFFMTKYYSLAGQAPIKTSGSIQLSGTIAG